MIMKLLSVSLAAALLPVSLQAAPAVSNADAEVAAVVATISRVCLPLARGGRIDAIRHATDLRQENGQWVMPVAGKAMIEVDPPDAANPTVCTADVKFDRDRADAILAGIGAWAGAQTPPLASVKVKAVENAAGEARTVSSWVGRSQAETDALIYSRKPDAGNLGEAVLFLSVTPTAKS